MIAEIITSETKLINADELAAMGDIGPCELIEGIIVPMSPTGHVHGSVELKIGVALLAFVEERQSGRVLSGEVGIYTHRDPDTVRGADVLFISHERYAQVRSRSFLDVAPELVVEVLSPRDSWVVVTQKLREYFDIGVTLVWIVDPQARRVFAYRSLTDVREFSEEDELPGDEALPGFLAPVADFFK